MTSRGVFNNNPGNIRVSNTAWQGKVAIDKNTDYKRSKYNKPEFEQFTAPEFGIRAIAKILLSYEKAGFNTVRKAITRWAPPNENDTESYVRFVIGKMKEAGLEHSADDVLDFDSYEIIKPFVCAIIEHENGAGTKYDDEVVRKALLLAGIQDAPPPPVKANKAITGATVAGGAGAATVVAQAAQMIPLDQLGQFIPLVQQVITVAPWVVGAAALVFAGWFLYNEYKKHKANTDV